MNAKAAEIFAQITIGSVIRRIGPNGMNVTVSDITEKSIHFSNGKRTDKRSLFHYTIVSK